MTDYSTAKKWFKDSDAVIVTAGNGLSQEEGLDILSEEDFDNRYGEIAENMMFIQLAMLLIRSLILGMNSGNSGVS